MTDNENKKFLAIYGSGGAGTELYEMISVSSLKNHWREILFIDDTKPQSITHTIKSYPFSDFVNIFNAEEIEIVIAVGEPSSREYLYKKVKEAGYSLGKVVSETALVSPSATLSDGVVVLGRSIVSSGAHIGSNTFINSTAIIGHNVDVGPHCLICSFSILAGHAQIGSCSFIGASSCIRDKIVLGDKVVVSMGAVVLKNVESGFVVMGNPARVISKSNDKVF